MARKVGIVGYGHLGQYLVSEIEKRDDLQLAFVWNRSVAALEGYIPDDLILRDLSTFKDRQADLIVEVAHPAISHKFGAEFLEYSDYMIGSPSALAEADLELKLAAAAKSHALYIPSGALWGGEDIAKMADRGSLQAVKVTMKKHPTCFRLSGELKVLNEAVKDQPVTLYEGNVRELCFLAPNNVNTMAAAALAAKNLGFDQVQGLLISDPSLIDCHIVEVEVWGAGDMLTDKCFHCKTVRRNPATAGEVTGAATYAAFLSSLLCAKSKGPGFHFC